jgi:hypothetical protein
MLRLMQVLGRLEQSEGDAFHTTWPQLAKALGLPVQGLRVQQIKDRYETAVKRSMTYLMEANCVSGWEVAYDGEEPTGILVSLPAGVAQLVRAAES